MKIERLKIGQYVWFHNGEFPVKECVIEICIEDNEVWLTDGNGHDPKEIYSTESKCKKEN